jgi:hypothetical protein
VSTQDSLDVLRLRKARCAESPGSHTPASSVVVVGISLRRAFACPLGARANRTVSVRRLSWIPSVARRSASSDFPLPSSPSLDALRLLKRSLVSRRERTALAEGSRRWIAEIHKCFADTVAKLGNQVAFFALAPGDLQCVVVVVDAS